jgi:hypothetical protein
LALAAAALAPKALAPASDRWNAAMATRIVLTDLPGTISFDGDGIALVGTIERRCETAHVQVLIDGIPTIDRTGLWQNHRMPGGDDVRFAWRWPVSGHHTIVLESVALGAGANPIDLTGIVLAAPADVAASRPPDAKP